MDFFTLKPKCKPLNRITEQATTEVPQRALAVQFQFYPSSHTLPKSGLF